MEVEKKVKEKSGWVNGVGVSRERLFGEKGGEGLKNKRKIGNLLILRKN